MLLAVRVTTTEPPTRARRMAALATIVVALTMVRRVRAVLLFLAEQ